MKRKDQPEVNRYLFCIVTKVVCALLKQLTKMQFPYVGSTFQVKKQKGKEVTLSAQH